MMRVLLVVLLLGLSLAALAQEPPPPAATEAPPVAAKARPDAPKPILGLGRGHVKTDAESEALWKQLGILQSDLHLKSWELYTLMSAEKVDRRAVKSKLAEAQALTKQLRATREQFRPFWIPQGDKDGVKAKAGGKGKGKGKRNAPAAPAAADPA